jgi:hypothetical protein
VRLIFFKPALPFSKHSNATKEAFMATLTAGDKAPEFETGDQDGILRRLTDYKGKRLFVFFYPKANTSG